MIRITAFAGALLCLFVNFAEARPHRQATGLHPDCNITMPCIVVKPFKAEVRGPLQPQMFTRKKHRAETVDVFSRSNVVTRAAATILPHPAGCRRNLFCGCGASVYLFGKVVNAGGLALARNWLGFPRAAPGPGMAEVTRGGRHVRVITASLGNGLYQFYDANSGGRLTRSHADHIKGIVVDPRGGNRYAGLM